MSSPEALQVLKWSLSCALYLPFTCTDQSPIDTCGRQAPSWRQGGGGLGTGSGSYLRGGGMSRTAPTPSCTCFFCVSC